MALHHSFAGKRVLITGGAQGIGRQLVQRFHDDGAIVFTIDKNSETVKELKDNLPSVTAEVVDLSDWDATRKAVESFGIIDHLINNAGIIVAEKFLDVTPDAAKKQIEVNVLAIVNVSQVVARGLIAAGRNGSIVNIASLASRIGSGCTTGAAIYSATKAGVENLTKSMAIELGEHNIRVNAVNPGGVNTPLLHSANKESNVLETYLPRVVFKRLIEPNEIADLAMFLLSPLSTMIVGETVVIDGGYLTT